MHSALQQCGLNLPKLGHQSSHWSERLDYDFTVQIIALLVTQLHCLISIGTGTMQWTKTSPRKRQVPITRQQMMPRSATYQRQIVNQQLIPPPVIFQTERPIAGCECWLPLSLAQISAESLQLFPRLVPGLQAPVELVDVGDIMSWNHQFSIQGLNNTIHTVLIVLDVETQSSCIIRCEHNVFFFVDDGDRKWRLGYTYCYTGGEKLFGGPHKSP